MDIPDGQLDSIRRHITELLDACSSTAPGDGESGRLADLEQVLEQLVDVMQRLHADNGSADGTPRAPLAQRVMLPSSAVIT